MPRLDRDEQRERDLDAWWDYKQQKEETAEMLAFALAKQKQQRQRKRQEKPLAVLQTEKPVVSRQGLVTDADGWSTVVGRKR